ncbi:permease [Bremerella sp. T1]|uniref:permease n=1 Tax=Bremerella sp. TYQ1 TaxID=3119568 RepID=UPI001CCC2A74|nr:permease [Bremerella volcania]UBM34717.1 permease [Bremerella volcania]
MNQNKYKWAVAGDVNAFFGLMLDNIADLLLTIGLLAAVFDFPTTFAIGHMVPGTAIGVLVGDLIFFWMALSLAKRSGRNDITAMPLGLDTPSTFGMVFFVLGPSFAFGTQELQLTADEAAIRTWHIGIWSIVLSGIFKSFFAFSSSWIRKVIPRAGLLGSLAAIALVLISFLPFIEALHFPIVGMTALSIVLITLVAHIRLPFKIPGAAAALIVSGAIYYAMHGLGILGATPEAINFHPADALLPTDWLAVFRFEWLTQAKFLEAAQYLPIVIPFALATVIGGIDCVESAAAAGDEYDTNRIIGAEAIATLVAGLCGGVIQTTPYIGHPAYKAMGGRAAYTLATAIFVGGAGVFGYFGFLYWLIPKPTVFPILVFIGLEITSQSFQATPKRHYPAVSIACIPALAALVLIYIGDLQGNYTGLSFQMEAAMVEQQDAETQRWQKLVDQGHLDEEGLSQLTENREDLGGMIQTLRSHSFGDMQTPPDAEGHSHATGLAVKLQTLRMLAGGFILTSMLWAAILAFIIDRRLYTAAVFALVCGAFSLFGVIHSPFPSGKLVLGWNNVDMPAAAAGQGPIYMMWAYVCVTVVLLVCGLWQHTSPPREVPDHEPES